MTSQWFGSNLVRNSIGAILACALLASVGGTARAQAPSAPAGAAISQQEAQLVRAQALYDQTHFEEAARALMAEPPRRGGSRWQELLARCWIQSGEPQKGRAVFESMLRADSTYRPDAHVLRSEEVGVFNDALGELRVGALRGGEAENLRFHAELGLGFNGGSPGFRGLEPGIGMGVPFGEGLEARLSLIRIQRSHDVEGGLSREHASAIAALVDVVKPIVPSLTMLRATAGAGVLLGVRYATDPKGGQPPGDHYTGIGYDLHAGLEANPSLGGGLALLARGVIRFARAPLSAKTDPDGFDLSLSGGSVSLGIQWQSPAGPK